MSKWKAGGKAMVDLIEGPGDAHTFRIPASGGPYFLVSASALQDVPAADPHQALKDAVVEAAKVYMKEGADVALYRELRKAVDALTAAQTPPKPDPVEVFTNAIRPARCVSICARHAAKLGPQCYVGGRECRDAIASGLAAVEAARGAK